MNIPGLTLGLWPLAAGTSSVGLTTSATAFTKTGYQVLSTGVPVAVEGFLLAMNVVSPPSADYAVFVDIALGATGSEVVVIRDFPLLLGSFVSSIMVGEIPFALPPNVQINIRLSHSAATASTYTVFFHPVLASPLTVRGANVCTTLGLANPVTALAAGSTFTSSATSLVFGTPVQYSTGVSFITRFVRIAPVVISSSFNIMLVKISSDSAGLNVLGPTLYLGNQNAGYGSLIGATLNIYRAHIPANTPIYLSSAALNNGVTVGYDAALTLFG